VGNKGGYCFIYEFVYDNLVFLQLITIFDLPFYLKKIHSKSDHGETTRFKKMPNHGKEESFL